MTEKFPQFFEISKNKYVVLYANGTKAKNFDDKKEAELFYFGVKNEEI